VILIQSMCARLPMRGAVCTETLASCRAGDRASKKSSLLQSFASDVAIKGKLRQRPVLLYVAGPGPSSAVASAM
jgi:hypothetical protein